MSGALFVITIPTEVEEERLRQKVRFDAHIQYANNSLPRTFKTTKDGKLTIPSSRSCDHHYGTFNKTSNASIIQESKTVSQITVTDADDKSLNSLQSIENLDRNGSLRNQKGHSANLRKSWEGLKELALSARKEQNEKKKKNNIELSIPSDSFMERVLKEILQKFKIEDYTWSESNNGKSYQVVFTLEHNEKYEGLLHKLNEWGIGDRKGSTVSILHCTTFHNQKEADLDEEENTAELNAQKRSAWTRFMNTLNARLNVTQIVKTVRQDAAITFDFVVLVVCAAILASFGLVEDSTIFLASSMLVSPLMGPIIAAIFGTVIKDRSLRAIGVVNELIGIAMATCVGFLFGLIICSIDERYGVGEGITNEMLARCELHSVVVGILTAIPSGAAAAVGILGGNVGSLVGVAISASLLPPAVNSGLLWALACIYLVFQTDGTKYNSVVKTSFYSKNQATELAILGTISMCVTITNIICVYGMGVLLLKIKEIAPLVTNSRQFWKHDIKIAREISKSCFSEDSVLANELASMPQEDKDVLGIQNMSSDLLKVLNIERPSYQNTWSPMGIRHVACINNHPTLQDIQNVYLTMSQQLPEHDQFLRKTSLSLINNCSTNISMPHSKGRTKYSLISEHLSNRTRRSSMPFDILRSPQNTRKMVMTGYNTEPLEGISEGNLQESDYSPDKRKWDVHKSHRKFTITPATENQ